MYRIKCDNSPILDLRKDELAVFSPRVKLGVNTVGESSFTIQKNHPHYSDMKHLKSIFEVSDNNGVIFRGRMTDDSIDFDNGKAVDLEGLMAFFNDSIVPPYSFPADFLENQEYITAAASGNVVEFFLKMLIDNHNSQVQDFQKFILGNVTVDDPNNYLFRENSEYQSTWENLKSRLFDSALGGYLCIRYETDGNYIDYLSEFTETNPQKIRYGENLMDISNGTSATETYSALLPIGKETEQQTDDSYEGDYVTITGTKRERLTLDGIEDGNVTSDIVKRGKVIFSTSAVEKYGWICKPVIFDEITDVENLLTSAVEQLENDGIALSNTIEAKAIDLHFSDSDIESFRIYKNVMVESVPHGLTAEYQLTELDIPLLEPDQTMITVGKTQKTFLDRQYDSKNDSALTINKVKVEMSESMEAVAKEIETLRQTVKDLDGAMSEIAQTANSVSVTITDESGTVQTIINPEQITIHKENELGVITSGFYYDTESGEFKFVGAGEFRSNGDDGSYLRIENNEIILYSADDVDKLRIGFNGDDDYSYIQFGHEETFGNVGLVKRFSNGVWFGTSAVKNITGALNKDDTGSINGVSGIFVNTIESRAYIVAGNDWKNLYTGEAVARFA